MPKQVVICDTSVLIALERIKKLDILQKLYSTINITPQIQNEFQVSLPPWIHIGRIHDLARVELLKLELDEGEASAIILATQIENSLLVIDEKKGRKIAKSFNLTITGLMGILLKAKALKKITSVKEILDDLDNVGFRISQRLRNKVLTLAKE